MPAVQELLVDRFVTAAAVSRSEFHGNHKSVMVLFVLRGCRLMAIKTSHAFVGMLAQFIFVYYGILGTGMAFSAFAGGPHKLSTGLLGLGLRTSPVYQKSREHESKSDDNRDKNRSKRHCPPYIKVNDYPLSSVATDFA